jgi:hypothetical protein
MSAPADFRIGGEKISTGEIGIRMLELPPGGESYRSIEVRSEQVDDLDGWGWL